MIENFLIDNAGNGLVGGIAVFLLIKFSAQNDKFIAELALFRGSMNANTKVLDKCLEHLQERKT